MLRQLDTLATLTARLADHVANDPELAYWIAGDYLKAVALAMLARILMRRLCLEPAQRRVSRYGCLCQACVPGVCLGPARG